MLVLEKLSMPGWEFKTDHIEQIFWLLDQCVCEHCKQTEAEYKADDEEEYEDAWTNFKPETYDSFSLLEKVEWLMGTACGCEFDFYDEADESDLTFIEIKS